VMWARVSFMGATRAISVRRTYAAEVPFVAQNVLNRLVVCLAASSLLSSRVRLLHRQGSHTPALATRMSWFPVPYLLRSRVSALEDNAFAEQTSPTKDLLQYHENIVVQVRIHAVVAH
jgi:hypothetical protein